MPRGGWVFVTRYGYRAIKREDTREGAEWIKYLTVSTSELGAMT